MNEGKKRRSIRQWFRDLFGARPDRVGPSGGLVSALRCSTEPLAVPADGGIISFSVDYELVFKARGLWQSTLDERADAYRESVHRHVLNTVWSVARTQLPHRPDLAEAAMNDALAEGWCQEEDGVLVSCGIRVYVRPAPAVAEVQEPLWRKVIELDMRQRVEVRRIEVVDDLLGRWCALFERYGNGPQVVHAAYLADQEVAQVLRGLADDRFAKAGELVEVMRQARDAHQFVGLYEFSNAYDRALRSFEYQAGLKPGTLVNGDMEDAG